jgi:hypothetical protein
MFNEINPELVEEELDGRSALGVQSQKLSSVLKGYYLELLRA